jgi:hypothetical protein
MNKTNVKLLLKPLLGKNSEDLSHSDCEEMWEVISEMLSLPLEMVHQTPYIQIIHKLVKVNMFNSTLSEHNRFNWQKVSERLRDSEKLCKMQDETIQEQTEVVRTLKIN